MRKITILALGLLFLVPGLAWAISGGSSGINAQNYPSTDSVSYFYLPDNEEYATAVLMFSFSTVGADDSCLVILEEGGWGDSQTGDYYWLAVDTLNGGDAILTGDCVLEEKVTLTNVPLGIRIKFDWQASTANYSVTWGYTYIFRNKY